MTSYLWLHRLAGSSGFLARLRYGTAFLACLALLGLGADYSLLLPPNSLIDGQLLQLQGRGLMPDIYQLASFAHTYFHIPAIYFSSLFYMIYMVCCLLLFFGIGSSLITLVLLFLHTSLFIELPQYSYGADYFLHILLFYCCSFHALQKFAAGNAAVFQGFFRIHLCFVYLFSGLDKALGATWWNGQAIWKTLHLPYFHTWIGKWLPYFPPSFFTLCSIAVVLLELSYPLALLIRRARLLFVSSALILHVCTALFMKLYFFALVMIVFNFIAWFTVSSLRFTHQSTYHFNTSRPNRKSREAGQKSMNRKEEQL